jgi:hypothetical protein
VHKFGPKYLERVSKVVSAKSKEGDPKTALQRDSVGNVSPKLSKQAASLDYRSRVHDSM